jgi:hypothetical protein
MRNLLVWLTISTLALSACKKGPPAGETSKPQSSDNTSNIQIAFTNAPLELVLDFYAKLTGRTVLMGTLPQVNLTVKASAKSREEAIQVLNDALKQQTIIAVPDGDKFVWVIMGSYKKRFESLAARITPVSERFPTAKLLVANNHADVEINWTVSSEAAVNFYAILVGTKSNLANSPFGGFIIILKTQTPLTRAEAIHALDILFALNGKQAVPSDNNSVKLVPFP